LPFFVLASLALLRARFAPPPTHSLFLVAALALRSPLLASLARRRNFLGDSAGNNPGQPKDVVLNGMVQRSEVVDVFILDPQDGTPPKLKDVTVKKPTLCDHVLKTHKITLVYNFKKSVAGNRREVKVRPPPVCPLPALH
jgi:hypothetical protein